VVCVCFFFFSSRRRHTRFSRDWSSDVCSSDLISVEELYCKQDLRFRSIFFNRNGGICVTSPNRTLTKLRQAPRLVQERSCFDTEIGRASCRERVKFAGDAVT